MSVVKLKICGISKKYHNGKQSEHREQIFIEALTDVSLQVSEGEIVGIIGPSGCGKSSLLDLLAGLQSPEQGDILLDGVSIIGKKGLVSYMPQKDVLFPWRTILDNVIVPLELQGVKRSKAVEEAQGLLSVFGLQNFEFSYPDALSGGMRQRAAFLRTYLCQKEVMLLDEPFGKLDALTRRQMQQWLLNIWQRFKHTLLFVTHDVDEAILLADRIYVMSARPGRIVAEVKVPLERPRSLKQTMEAQYSSTKAELLRLLEEGVTYHDE